MVAEIQQLELGIELVESTHPHEDIDKCFDKGWDEDDVSGYLKKHPNSTLKEIAQSLNMSVRRVTEAHARLAAKGKLINETQIDSDIWTYLKSYEDRSPQEIAVALGYEIELVKASLQRLSGEGKVMLWDIAVEDSNGKGRHVFARPFQPDKPPQEEPEPTPQPEIEEEAITPEQPILEFPNLKDWQVAEDWGKEIVRQDMAKSFAVESDDFTENSETWTLQLYGVTEADREFIQAMDFSQSLTTEETEIDRNTPNGAIAYYAFLQNQAEENSDVSNLDNLPDSVLSELSSVRNDIGSVHNQTGSVHLTAWIDSKLIQVGAGTQTRRDGENLMQVSSYAEKMESDEWEWKREPLPEVMVDGEGSFFVISGHHRVRAAQQINHEIFCRVHQGSFEQAQLMAIRSNSNSYHGIPETRADFRNRVERFFCLLEQWDAVTQIQELEDLKTRPHANMTAIDELIGRINTGKTEMWSCRVIACYLNAPNSFRTINAMINQRQNPTPKTQKSGGSGSGGGGVRSPKPSNPSSKSTNQPQKSTTPSSVNQELKQQAQSLGLPTRTTQVLPDTSESDRNRNTAPNEVDDRPFAVPLISEEERQRQTSEYLIGFVSNVHEMNAGQVSKALESISRWLQINGHTEHLSCLESLINDLDF